MKDIQSLTKFSTDTCDLVIQIITTITMRQFARQYNYGFKKSEQKI